MVIEILKSIFKPLIGFAWKKIKTRLQKLAEVCNLSFELEKILAAYDESVKDLICSDKIIHGEIFELENTVLNATGFFIKLRVENLRLSDEEVVSKFIECSAGNKEYAKQAANALSEFHNSILNEWAKSLSDDNKKLFMLFLNLSNESKEVMLQGFASIREMISAIPNSTTIFNQYNNIIFNYFSRYPLVLVSSESELEVCDNDSVTIGAISVPNDIIAPAEQAKEALKEFDANIIEFSNNSGVQLGDIPERLNEAEREFAFYSAWLEEVFLYFAKRFGIQDEEIKENTGSQIKDASKGYEKADTYDRDGDIVQDYGGGKCQLSSTLYNAVLQASGLVVVERHEHSRDVDYVPEGRDAAIAYRKC